MKMEQSRFILVVEDSPTQAGQIEETLGRAGYSSKHAYSGVEALALLAKEKPMLVLADIVMPEMDGFELCRSIKALEGFADVPVILLTQLSDPREVVKGMECGADDFVVKPYNEQALLAKIGFMLPAAPAASSVREGARILVAEDSPTQAEQLKFMLEKRGYSVAVAPNGQECFDLAVKAPPALIISDIVMPVMDGYELAWRIKQDERTARVPVILITSLMDRKDTVLRAKVEADAFFSKPYDEHSLASKVEALLSAARKTGDETSGIEVSFAGQRYSIRSGRKRILSFLLSTYENAVARNRELIDTQKALRLLNESLEERVMKRTEQLQASEANYRRLLETSADAIVVVGLDNTVFFMNRAAEALFGVRHEEMAGKRFFMTISALGDKDVEIERGGAKAYAEARTVPTTWGDDSALLATFRETTERKRMEEEILKASKLDSLGTLAGGIAHDFNNLLAAVIGNVSVAKMMTQGNEKLSKVLTDADNAANRARDLTRQLLTFSKGGLPLKKPVDLSDIIRESASFSLLGSATRCEVELPGSLPAVEADEGQISQVIHNLVINADQAMPGGGVVTITAGPYEGAGREGRFLRIRVKDTGKGIDKENLSKVFDPYFTTKKEGSGLGLATVYSIVKNHGGFIEVESSPGKGTTFSIYLPVTGKRPARSEAVSAGEIERGSGRVLIMDDEEMVRDAAAAILSELGYEVEFASDGKEALVKYGREMAGGRPFDAVIMDLTIPAGMGGREAVKKVLEIDPGARVIVSSGYSSDDIMSDYEKFGFSAVIAKPYRVSDLGRVVKDVIDGRKKP